MPDNPLPSIAAIFVLGIGAYWLAWRLRFPAILLLLLAGICAGPGTSFLASRHILFHSRFLDPNHLLGPLLLPLVSLSVGLILFEGGLTLTLSQISGVTHIVTKLVTLGAAVMGLCAVLGAKYILGLPTSIAILLGAILIVTGPTVIGPLLRHVRPVGQVGPILRWEGIVIDPIGALLAVLAFEAAAGGAEPVPAIVLHGIFLTTAVGIASGAAAAFLLILLLRHYWIPDYLQSAVTLMLVAAAFTISSAIQHEAGLFATTIMGVILANQRLASIHHIHEFKENLSVLLISSLFIILGARLDVAQIAELRWSHLFFLLLLVFIARPLAVAVSTLGKGITWRERLFMACMAPRGVVAAAVASVFAIELRDANVPGADQLVPAVFAVIVGTVTIYGLAAAPLARALGLAKPDSLGFLIVGANPLARLIASALHEDKFDILLVDTNPDNISSARLAGLPTFAGSANSEQILERIQLSGIGRLLALTPSETVNALTSTRFARLFGRSETYQLPSPIDPASHKQKVSEEHRGRPLFSNLTFPDLLSRIQAGHTIKRTKLSEQFTLANFQTTNPDAIPLYFLSPTGTLALNILDLPPTPAPNTTIVSLAPASR
ncbi:MAG TPA: cation:proton antiporter [Tepidisphaeraceae bacterium]|jgi:NhaP-type Na+/H+ or K+/H+ antiporter|nr:cation:proton antiporter [Tepidisphaeraceae bacterium]